MEDYAANPLDLVLLLFCGGLLLSKRTVAGAQYRLLLFGLILSGLLFCLYLVWQPWHTRLHLPLFALGAIVISHVLVAGGRTAVLVVSSVVFAASIPPLVGNQLRPLLTLKKPNLIQSSRTELYFTASNDFSSFTNVEEYVKRSKCRDIGFNVSGDPLVYPLLEALGVGTGGYRARNIGVSSASGNVIEPEPKNSCLVICTGCVQDQALRNSLERDFSLVAAFGPAGVFAPGHASIAPVLPTADSITPEKGVGRTQVFSAVYSEASGYHALGPLFFLVNATLVAPGGCFITYNQSADQFYLANDSGTNSLGPMVKGESLSNSQCVLESSRTAASGSGNSVILTIALTFRNSFAGPKLLFINAGDLEGKSSGWQRRASFTVSMDR
jgi:hypothetical protein